MKSNMFITKICNILFLNLLIFKNIKYTENLRHVKLTGIDCESVDTSFCIFTLCKMKAVRRDATEVSVHATLLKTPVNNISLYAAIKKRGFEDQKLFAFKIDACAFLRNKRRNPLASVLYATIGFQDYSNMNHTCPYNHNLRLERYRFLENNSNINLVPIPTGRYTLNTVWSAYNVERAKANVYFQVLD